MIAAIDADPRLPAQRDRCEVYRRLARWGRSFDEQRYAQVGSKGCAGFPIAEHPWGDSGTDVAAGR